MAVTPESTTQSPTPPKKTTAGFKLDKFQDALKEVGNMGAGKASGALARLLNQQVTLSPPEIYLSPVKEIPDLIGGPQKMVVGTYASLSGDLPGTVLIVYATEAAMDMADLIQKKTPGTTKTLAETDQIKLKEVGHTLTKSYLQSLTDFLELTINPSEERIVSTFGESLTDLVLLGIKEKYAILIKTHFVVPNTKAEGEFILLVAIESLTKVIEAIKHKIN